MIFKQNIFAVSLREEKVYPVPILQFLSPSLQQMGQITFIVEVDVHFQSQCSVKAFVLQSQALVANGLNFWRCLEIFF